jgi:hypothetical protein
MDLEHVNHFEREGVLPIAFSLFHYTNMGDASFMMITGIAPVWNDEWQAEGADDRSTTTASTARSTRWCSSASATTTRSSAYQRTVFDRTEALPR